MTIWRKISGFSPRRLLTVACGFALFGLCSMAYSVIVPRPLPVIFAMSIGHAAGGLAFLCYLFAVVIDSVESRTTKRDGNTPAGK